MERSQTIRGNLKNRTADEAYRLGISEDKLIELANAGTIPGTKLGPTHLDIRPRGGGCRFTGTSKEGGRLNESTSMFG
jgi:hypothetical protein